jgi:hypothetical protein
MVPLRNPFHAASPARKPRLRPASRAKQPPQVIYLRAGRTPPPLANSVGLLRGMVYGTIGAFVLWVVIAIVWRLMRGG